MTHPAAHAEQRRLHIKLTPVIAIVELIIFGVIALRPITKASQVTSTNQPPHGYNGFPSPRLAAQTQAPQPAQPRSEELLRMWNMSGDTLIAMAQDFPEDKYDFKVQKDQRTFALNLLHAAALDFILIRRISGSNLGPDFGEGYNPTREQFKPKADVIKFVRIVIPFPSLFHSISFELIPDPAGIEVLPHQMYLALGI